jgi:hypothetical protein
MAGKLNIFQRTMLQWNGPHAYNAVHVVRVPQSLDLPRLSHVIDSEMEQLCLTGLSIDNQRGVFEYRGGPVRNELKRVESGPDINAVIGREMETQVNTSFVDQGEINPFRFFVIQEEHAFYLGLAYFHVVAGAESIVLLLKQFVSKYLGQGPVFSYPLNIYPTGYGKLPPWEGKLLFRKLSNFPSMVARLKKSSKPRYHDLQDYRNGVSVFSLPPEEFQALIRTAKRWSITLNDLFLALLLKSLSPLAIRRFSAKRRRVMTVGSIVNIRRDLRIDSLKTFGLFLGFFIVSHSVPEGISVERLAREIQQQTLRIKESKLYLGTPIDLWLGRILGSLQSPDHRNQFYRKHYPLWGGITNMNLNPLWEQRGKEQEFGYLRAVSTGPITPLVLSVTTVKEVANIGLSFRKTAFSELEIEGFISRFKNHVNQTEVEA